MKRTFYTHVILLLTGFILSAVTTKATIYEVTSLANTNTGTGTSGTLYYCISQANQTAGPHSINFTVAGTININTNSAILPVLTKQIAINATTAPGYIGLPVVLIDGAGLGGGNGIEITAANCELYGLEIANFPYRGIYIHGNNADNFIIGAAGKGNVIRNNNYYGISIDEADYGIIAYNKVGTDATGSTCAGNNYDGIDFENAADYNQILFNHISCNGYNGIQIGGSGFNVIKSNIVGPLNNDCQGNEYRGIDIEDGSNNNTVGGSTATDFNKIAGNLYLGIEVKNNSANNLISGNSYLCNDYGAIALSNFGNNNMVAPVISTASTTSITGLATPNATVEIFKSQDTNPTQCVNTPGNQGADFIGSTVANSSGAWSLSGSFGGKVVATAIDANGNTSPFSSSISTGIADTLANECSGYIPFISASFNSSASTVCEKQCISFTDQSQNASAWQWTFEGGTPSSSTLQNPDNICYSDPGVYEVKMVVYGAGGNDSSVATLLVTVNATPAIPEISQQGDTLLCTPAVAYQWFLNTVIIAGATNQQYAVVESGFYSVEITDSVGCTALSTADYIDITGIIPLPDQWIRVYIDEQTTNPVLEIHGMSGNKAQITVFDVLGKVWLQEDLNIGTDFFKQIVSIPSGAAGICFLRLQSGDRLFVEKFIHQ